MNRIVGVLPESGAGSVPINPILYHSITPFPGVPGRLIAGHRPLKASVVVRVHPRQPISARW